jgi:hypothetical protein
MLIHGKITETNNMCHVDLFGTIYHSHSVLQRLAVSEQTSDVSEVSTASTLPEDCTV